MANNFSNSPCPSISETVTIAPQFSIPNVKVELQTGCAVYTAGAPREALRVTSARAKLGEVLMTKLLSLSTYTVDHRAHKWLRLLALLALATSWFAVTATAATFSATLDRDTLTLGEDATISLTFAGEAPLSTPSPPNIPGLQIDYVGQSYQISTIQGESSSTVTHSFRVTPRQTGDFVIPALTAEVNGQKLTTQPLKLKVLKPGAPPPEAINSGTQLAFLRLVLPKKQVYVGENMVFQLELYLAGNVRNIRNFQPPNFPFDGCVIGKMVQGNQRRVQVGNAVYTVIPLSFALKAVKTGTLNLGSVTGNVVVEIPSGRRERDPFFDQFGGGFGMFGVEQKPVALATDADAIESLPLPKGNVPANFNGAVGTFSMNFSAGPTNVAVGDPITVHVQLAGRGGFDTLTLPEQPAWRDFKTYPPSSKVETTDQFGLQGAKTFEQVIVPQTTDIKQLPPVAFSFFDPEQKAYRTLSQAPVPLVVRPSGAAPAPTIATANRGVAQETPAPAQDIVQIKTRLGTVAQIDAPLVQQSWFLALQSVPVLALISTVVWRRRVESLANNPRLRRQRQVAQIIHDGLNELRQLASANKSEEFFASCRNNWVNGWICRLPRSPKR